MSDTVFIETRQDGYFGKAKGWVDGKRRESISVKLRPR